MTATLPGLSVTAVAAPAPDDPLRTDVAVFLGRTVRGPAGTPVRVTGWDEVLRAFGPPAGDRATPRALHGYFENGGRVAWVIRVSGAGTPAATEWTIGDLPRAGFGHGRYRVVASSPGGWAGGTRVAIRFQASSVAGPPTVTVRVSTPGEPAETFAGLPPSAITERLAASRLIRLEPLGPPAAPPEPSGPLTASWDLILTGGTAAVPSRDDYRAAIRTQADLPEPALVALPDLGADLAGEDWEDTVLDLLAEADARHDRQVLLDLPAAAGDTDTAVALARRLTGRGDDLLRSAAVYHPWLVMPDPAVGRDRTVAVPPSGHVAGLIARLDAERGTHHTPANAVLLDAVDLDPHLPEAQQGRLFTADVNLLRSAPGRGLLVWGGRTLGGGFVAHRRLTHLLVRAMNGAAGPLAFDVNGPELRLALVRAVTSVLLAAYRSGALAGDRPQEAFRVRCDDENNPPGADPALVVCDVQVAPATPMEFITIRLVLGQDRGLEVLEQ
ncbi:phage tail sheath subtilisin-like domain-containing protein [Actinoplanes sp. NBRC 101535]|uniref:phage tail sheath subtilisin-like domain-containing protein n=1 Tax=Actinoplanes sp. NBRC 101535 TaxID=3032196 RepID=UPI0024A59A5E|nr:phage tail sheath subtilisin-like domain-containing protein [Actinoplanes sp. NBRC 101535]GLY05328.1 tail protein [Actinoplanes sp. NBRC 101535]